MKKVLFLLLCMATLVGCDSDDDSVNYNLEGNYTGVFERNDSVSNVQLSLKNATFSGESEVQKFPAICRGAFIVSGSSVTFENVCPWTAEFDWTLILNGSWNIDFEDNNLILTNKFGDRYLLTKQKID
ncbi:hypothetical protein [Flavimarina sp. Hel_I_48]|uniref:hypothetical protein n=1 Tax=Flavimarina sp. Hel_I_48 TaxID=1392488 RepID=UPI001F1291E8|nr:hypothetical protein [Flavimarina sp. Hel_I_48]